MVSELHKEVDLPAGVAVHRVDLGKGGETRDARQTQAIEERGITEVLERGKERTSPAPTRAQEEVSSPSQGPQNSAQLPWGCQPVGQRMGATLGDGWENSEPQLTQWARKDWKRDPGGEGWVHTLRTVGHLSPEGLVHHPTHLLAASIVAELVITGMQRLPSIDGIQDHLVPHNYLWGQAGRVRVGRAKAPGLSLASVCPSKKWTRLDSVLTSKSI